MSDILMTAEYSIGQDFLLANYLGCLIAEYHIGQDFLLISSLGPPGNFTVTILNWVVKYVGNDRYDVRQTSHLFEFNTDNDIGG